MFILIKTHFHAAWLFLKYFKINKVILDVTSCLCVLVIYLNARLLIRHVYKLQMFNGKGFYFFLFNTDVSE